MTSQKGQLALSITLFDSFSKLSSGIQAKVKKLIVKYQQDPDMPGLHRERVQGTRNLYSIRVDQQYRGIMAFLSRTSTAVLLHIDNHDEAYAWARRHQFGINPESGTLQVLDTETVAPAPQAEATTPASSLLLDGWRDRELRRLGIPDEQFALARTITDEASLKRIEMQFSEEVRDALYMQLSGYSKAEIMDELAGRQVDETIDTEDLDAALQRPGTKARFWIVDDEEELKRMLDDPQAKWRIFLHPSQRRLVDRPWAGPVRVLGGAGTGKTVVAMHRVKWLLGHHAIQETDRILFLTFTANLATDLKSNLKTLITSSSAFRRLEVVHLDRWVSQFLHQYGFQEEMVFSGNTRLEQAWQTVLAASGSGQDNRDWRFYQEEWERVILAQGLTTRQEYLRAQRTGRGRPLTRPKRAQLWEVFEAFRAHLREQGLIEKEDAYRVVRQIIQDQKTPLPYVSVVVDEAQDFGNAAFRLIHAVAHAGPLSVQTPDPEANRLFIVGDAHQRIYDRQVVLSHCGINIRGRSTRLRINYRTSEPILHAAISILKDMEVDDLDGNTDTLKGYRSLFGGPQPELRICPDLDQAARNIQTWIESLQADWNYHCGDFCLVARTLKIRDQWKKAMQELGMATHCLEGRQADNQDRNALRLATAHRVKGLEFAGIVILEASPENYPLQNVLTYIIGHRERERFHKQERSLLHVAVSRARRHLMLCTSNTFSPFLAHLDLDKNGNDSD